MLVSLSKPYSFHSAALSSSLCNPNLLHSTLIFLGSPSHSLSLSNREEDSNRIHKSQNELTR
uniref:Uncharacterized protein n=1 Tax=Helianthus annuus TaxID=4232 RepID=A0A251TKL6_HELAN